jgi:hypothetical protein
MSRSYCNRYCIHGECKKKHRKKEKNSLVANPFELLPAVAPVLPAYGAHRYELQRDLKVSFLFVARFLGYLFIFNLSQKLAI